YGYIATHSRLFYDSLGLHGNVDLSFQLRDNGKMSDFRIEKSLLPEADREAIRLVQQGPAWELLKGKKARVLVRIPF
ncbi:MAG TPA: energy transducer TonB, partial [Puia sp.]|nr:energy transducer TonB [Puia sp.]